MSDKLDMRTKNITQKNVEKISALFPHCVTEATDNRGKTRHLVDFESLKQELSESLVSDIRERYQFTWPDKQKYRAQLNIPITKTLRPYRKESLDFDNTENLYIEGDNLDALKLLRETYLNRVKVIYIDPPYNTGNDFVYKDNFKLSDSEYHDVDGNYCEDGIRLFKNVSSNGRFHTDWLNMMYPRLKIARDLLSDDGVIFISIDDNELKNLRNICDEIFGEGNFIATVIWERAYAPVNLKKHFSESHDYILSYAKHIDKLVCNGLPRDDRANERYYNPDNDPRGPWKSSDLSVGPAVQDKIYEITTPSGKKVLPPKGYCWRLTKNRFDEYIRDNRIWFGEDGNNVPSIKRFLNEVKNTVTPMTIWKYQDVGHSQRASQELKKLFGNEFYFAYPKPVELIERVLRLYSDEDSIILDFFSGSATTAHAVMNLNAADGGRRRYIMVQLPEEVDIDSDAYKAGLINICEIGKERIRRAGEQVRGGGHQQKLTDYDDSGSVDIGFRVLKIDDSNMKDVYYTPDDTFKHGLDELLDNVKEDRTPEDLLFQVMLELGVELSATIEENIIEGKRIFSVDEDYLVACFDIDVSENVITEIAKKKSHYAVMRDYSMSDDNVAVNFEQIFKTHSPETIRKIL